MLERILRTEKDYIVTVLRVVLGVVFFAHGAQKALGWFGGPGFNGTVGMFAQMGIGEPLAVLAIAAEFLGGLGLIIRTAGPDRESWRHDKYDHRHYSCTREHWIFYELGGQSGRRGF